MRKNIVAATIISTLSLLPGLCQAMTVYTLNLDASLAGGSWNDIHINIDGSGDFKSGDPVLSVHRSGGSDLGHQTTDYSNWTWTINIDLDGFQTNAYPVLVDVGFSDGSNATQFDYYFTKDHVKTGQSFSESHGGQWHNNPVKQPSSVPVPSSIVLLISGFGGLLSLGKKVRLC